MGVAAASPALRKRVPLQNSSLSCLTSATLVATPRQAGEEPDFILVSCTGAGIAEEDREKVLKAKLVSPCNYPVTISMQHSYLSAHHKTEIRTLWTVQHSIGQTSKEKKAQTVQDV